MTGGKISVLTEEQVRKIHQDRRLYRDIAVEYGITSMTVSNIKSGKAWKHLKMEPTMRGKTYKRMPKNDSAAENYAKAYSEFIEHQVTHIEDIVTEERTIM